MPRHVFNLTWLNFPVSAPISAVTAVLLSMSAVYALLSAYMREIENHVATTTTAANKAMQTKYLMDNFDIRQFEHGRLSNLAFDRTGKVEGIMSTPQFLLRDPDLPRRHRGASHGNCGTVSPVKRA